jgi:hypothetical protein
MMFQLGTLQDLERQVQVFIDIIVEGRKLQRLEERGQIHDVADVARCFQAKTETQVPEQWTKLQGPSLLKGSCMRSEDETIITFVAQHGTKSWSRNNLVKAAPMNSCDCTFCSTVSESI